MSALVGVIMGSKSDWSTLCHTVEMLDKLGIPNEVKVVSAHRTPDLLFQYAQEADARGIQVIIPDCECAILLRPTQSLTLYIQQSMRCMRYRSGKKALILDHVGNYA